MARIHRRTIKKVLINDLDNHEGAVTNLEPEVLECEVKQALGSTNKTSGGDRIPAEIFQTLEDDAVKVLQSICQQIWKLSSGHRSGRGQFSFQSQRRTMPRNVQTNEQLYSFHILAK